MEQHEHEYPARPVEAGFDYKGRELQEAACEGMDTNYFYPPENRGRGTEHNLRVVAAKKVCGGCPIASQCLDYALRTDERWGIWGGLTVEERDRLKASA